MYILYKIDMKMLKVQNNLKFNNKFISHKKNFQKFIKEQEMIRQEKDLEEQFLNMKIF